MLGADEAKGMKIDAKISPQKTKKRFRILSAKKPNIGCSILEQICVIATRTVAIAIEKPNFAAMNGIKHSAEEIVLREFVCSMEVRK